MGAFKGFRRPVRGIEMLLAGCLMLLVTSAQTTTVFGWAPVRWSEVNALPHVVLLASGPVAGLIGAYGARTCMTALVTRAPGRPWPEITRGQLTPLVVASVVGYLLGLLPAALLAADRATYAGPDVVGLGAGVLGLVLCMIIGYVVGARIRFPKSAVVALAASILVTGGLMALSDLMTSSGIRASLLAVIPFWAFDISRGWVEVWSTTAFRGLTLVAFAGLLLSLLTVGREARWMTRRERLGQLAFGAAAPVLLVALALVVQPDVVRAARPTPVECIAINDGSLCMYAEEAAVLERTAGVIDDVHRRFGVGASTGDAWSIRPEDLRSAPAPGDTFISPQYQGTLVNFDESLRFDVISSISGVRACEDALYKRYGIDYYNTAPPEALTSAVFQEMIANSLVYRLGGTKVDGLVLPGDDGEQGWPRSTELANTIGSLSDDQLASWLASDAEALAGCSAQPGDLP